MLLHLQNATRFEKGTTPVGTDNYTNVCFVLYRCAPQLDHP